MLRAKRMSLVICCRSLCFVRLLGWCVSKGRWGLCGVQSVTGLQQCQGQLGFREKALGRWFPCRQLLFGSVIAWRHTDYLTEEHNSLCRSIFLGCMRCLHTVWVSSVKSYRGWRRSASSRSWRNSLIWPVLKHGPRSLTYVRVFGCLKPIGVMKVKGLALR